MFLTLPLFFKKTVPGHIFRGKRRLVQQIKFKDIKKALEGFRQQEYNMMLLRRPYLTLAQSSGHAKELDKTGQKFKFWYDNKIKPPFKPNVKIEDRLSHMNCSLKWE